MKCRTTIVLFAVSVSLNNSAIAQLVDPIIPRMDTLYMSAGSMTPTIDPDPGSNPFLTDSAATFGSVRSMDDPGGPGSGGGNGSPPPDAAIPIDGGVVVLMIAGAAIGLKRRKKK